MKNLTGSERKYYRIKNSLSLLNTPPGTMWEQLRRNNKELKIVRDIPKNNFDKKLPPEFEALMQELRDDMEKAQKFVKEMEEKGYGVDKR